MHYSSEQAIDLFPTVSNTCSKSNVLGYINDGASNQFLCKADPRAQVIIHEYSPQVIIQRPSMLCHG